MKWIVKTNRHPTTSGYEWGWIDGCPGNVCWSEEPHSKLNKEAARRMADEHNKKGAKND